MRYYIDNNIYQGDMPNPPDPKDAWGTDWVVVSLNSDGAKLDPSIVVHAHLHVPIEDAIFPGIRWMRQMVELLDVFTNHHKKIYIHCLAGVSRSVMLTAGYLIYHGYTLQRALSIIGEVNTKINPNPSFISGLREWEQVNNERPFAV